MLERIAAEIEGSGTLELPAGASGVAAIYTDRGQAIRIIRKVVVPIQTWLNYAFL